MTTRTAVLTVLLLAALASALAAGHGLPILLALAAGLGRAPLALYLTLTDG